MRKYKSGSKFAFWRWTETDTGYLTRLHLIMTPWFAICLHWINKPDPEPYLHDHPVSFLSIILRGWYREERWTSKKKLHITCNRWWNFVRASRNDRHTIVACAPKTLTLCLMGPKKREWGFYIGYDGDTWQYWKDYYAQKRAEENTECDTLDLNPKR